MPDKGQELNKRVWKLFEKAGFKTKPSNSDPSEEVVDLGKGKTRTIDLSASDSALRVKIIGWNKSRTRLSESFTVHMNDYKTLLGPAKANAVLMVSAEKDFTAEDKELAKDNHIRLWNKEELEYYEALVDTIGSYARYEIIHSFDISTQEETNIFNVLAVHFHQPLRDSTTELYLFTAPPILLLRTCVVLRRAQGNKDAYQRILQKKRLSNIGDFVRKHDALLPPNIIAHMGDQIRWEPLAIPVRDSSGRAVTLTRSADYEIGMLSIPQKYASMELIDGQHRLFGFSSTDPATQENFNLVVLGLRNVDAARRTDTFISINDNARRVDANLVAYLKYNPDEASCQRDNALMATKVVVELNGTTPFRKKIRLLDVGNQRITLKGFAGYDLKGLLGPRGLLRKYYPNESGKYIGALRLYFSKLKSVFGPQWDDPDRYIIFTNRGISAFLKLLRSILKTEEQELTESIVGQYLEPLRSQWPDSKWETAQLRNAYVGAQGWKNFHRDLVKTIRKKFRHFKE